MFGALNRFISRLDAEPAPRQADAGPQDSSYGFQVLRNVNKDLALEPWFDFIIGINGHYLVSLPDRYSFKRKIATDFVGLAGSQSLHDRDSKLCRQLLLFGCLECKGW